MTTECPVSLYRALDRHCHSPCPVPKGTMGFLSSFRGDDRTSSTHSELSESTHISPAASLVPRIKSEFAPKKPANYGTRSEASDGCAPLPGLRTSTVLYAVSIEAPTRHHTGSWPVYTVSKNSACPRVHGMSVAALSSCWYHKCLHQTRLGLNCYKDASDVPGTLTGRQRVQLSVHCRTYCAIPR